MKKLLPFIAIIAACGSEVPRIEMIQEATKEKIEETAPFEYSAFTIDFMFHRCFDRGHTMKFCRCMLKEAEANISEKEYLDMSANTMRNGKVPKKALDILRPCHDIKNDEKDCTDKRCF